jgi:hypothetical protein
MRSHLLLPLACALAAICVIAASHSATSVGDTRIRAVSVKVSPEIGNPRARFRAEFRARNRARGAWVYDIEATGEDETREDCTYDFQTFRHPKRGDLVVVKMPRRGEAPWCPGEYEGVVFLQRRDAQGEEIVDKVVGRYRFRVIG